MRLDRIAIGDIVLAKIKGRSIFGEVLEITDRQVNFRPLCPGQAGGTPRLGRSLRTGGRPADAPRATPKNSHRQCPKSSCRCTFHHDHRRLSANCCRLTPSHGPERAG
jgi:hypothetical protein